VDIQLTLTAGLAVEFQEESDFFRIFDAAQADLSVIFYRAGKEVARAENVGEGYSEKFERGQFDKVRIESAAGGDTHFVTRLGNSVAYDKAPTGDVTVVGGAFTQSRASVTNVVQQLIAANGSRKYVQIQNNDASAVLRVTVDGNDPGLTAGFRVEPKQVFELPFYCATGAIKAMMETATATANNVEFCEG
jgi:hypothetical protein